MSPAPMLWATLTWPPMRGSTAMPLDSHMNMPAAPTAATAPAPTRPIQIMSIRL